MMSALGMEATKNDSATAGASLLSESWPQLVEAIEAAATLEATGAQLENPKLLLRPLHLAEAVASARIVGNVVSVEDLLLAELGASLPMTAGDDGFSPCEAFNSVSTLQFGIERLEVVPFSHRLLQGLHRSLMFRLGDDRKPGEIRRDDDLLRRLTSLEAAMNADPPSHLRLVHCLDVHRRLLTLAPFRVGNGPFARLVLALMLQQLNRHSSPWLGLSEAFAGRPTEYAAAISGDWPSWIKFGLEAISRQAWNGVALCHRLTMLRREIEEQATDEPRGRQVVETLFESPIVTTPFIQQRLDVPYTTAKRDVRRLVELGLLRVLSSDSPKTFVCDRIITAWKGKEV